MSHRTAAELLVIIAIARIWVEIAEGHARAFIAARVAAATWLLPPQPVPPSVSTIMSEGSWTGDGLVETCREDKGTTGW